jgi:hypothetical protein
LKGNLAHRSETLLDQRTQNSNTGDWAWNSIIESGDQITRCGYSQLDADGDVWIAETKRKILFIGTTDLFQMFQPRN